MSRLVISAIDPVTLEVNSALQTTLVITSQPVYRLVASGIIREVNLGGGSTSDFVFNETPSGLVNGSNATFMSAFDFIPETVEVFIGIKLKKPDDFNTSGNRTITLYQSPLSGENILINYIKL